MLVLWRILLILTPAFWRCVHRPCPALAYASVSSSKGRGLKESVGTTAKPTASSSSQQTKEKSTAEDDGIAREGRPESKPAVASETAETAAQQVAEEDELAREEVEEDIEEEEELVEEKEAEHDEELTEYGVSVMLLGAIVFVMSLFIATNLDDDDMRFYVWKVISSTIAILVAVMTFTSLNDFMHSVVLKGQSHRIQVLWDFSQCIIYNIAMQITVACCVMADHETAELKMRSYGNLMAHASGFAAIHFGGCLQQGELFEISSPYFTFVGPVVMAVALWMMFVILRLSRGWFSKKFLIDDDARAGTISRSKSTDGYSEVAQDEGAVKDFAAEEDDEDHRHTAVQRPRNRGSVHIYVAPSDHQNWEATIYEAENDVSALCVSFLMVQALRVNITGVMPDEMGEDAEGTKHSKLSIQLVGACAGGFVFCACLLEVVAARLFTSDHLADMASMSKGFSWKIFFFLLGKRMALVGAQSCGMGMAWSLLCDCQWFLEMYVTALGSPDTIVFKIILALAVSFIAFWIVFVLDKISDAEKFGDKDLERLMDRSICKVIMALGVLVGFAWEHSFDRAVEVVVDLVPCPAVLHDPIAMEMIGTFFICTLIVFSWRKFVLRKVINLEHIRESNDMVT